MTLSPYFKFFIALYFLLAMHIILETPGGVGLYFSYNIFAWIITTILISLGLWQITLNKKIYYSPLLVWLTLGCICLIIPVFYSFEFTDHAIPRIIALIGGLLILFCFYQFNFSKKDALHLLCLILMAVLIEAIFGLIQFFILEPGDWGGYTVGSSRPHGVFLQPNVMASFMATGTAIALFLSTRQHLFKNKVFIQSLIIPGLFLTSALLTLLQSRTGFVALIAVILFTAPYVFVKNKKQLLLNIIIMIVAVVSFKTVLGHSDTPIRAQGVYENVGLREEIFTVSLDMIKEKPILGYGYGGFTRGFIDHFNQYAISNPEIGDTITNLSHPHNEVLYWVIEGGVITLIAFILFTCGYLLTWRKLPLPKALLVLSLIFPILLHSQLEFPFYSSTSHWLIFLMMLWLLDRYVLAAQATYRFVECKPTFLIRFFAMLIPVIFIPFLVTTLQTAQILVEHEKSSNKSISRFTEIINPIAWQSRLDAAVYAHIFISGINSLDEKKLTSYLEWALKRIKHKPRIILYENCLYILKVLKKPQQHQALLKEAKQTYPQKKDWDNYLDNSAWRVSAK